MSRRALSLGRRGAAAGMAQARTGNRIWLRLAWIVGLVVLIAGAVVLVRWMRTSPVFMVDRLETGRYRYSTSGEVEGLLQERLGQNIWTCDADSLRRDLERLPWVARAEITRRPPGTLAVRLREWSPRLLIAGADSLAADALLSDGSILPLPGHVPPPAVPVFRHPDGLPSQEDRTALLALIAAIEASGLAEARTVTAISQNGTGLILEMGPTIGRLLVGREAFTSRLRRYLAVADDLPPASSVDLRFEGQVYVKELTATPQSG